MKLRLPFMLWLLICELFADFLAKQFELTNSMYIYVGALFLYALGNAIWLFAVKNGVGLARGTIIFGVLSTIGTLLMAYFRFHEKTSTINLIGIALALVGLILMDRE